MSQKTIKKPEKAILTCGIIMPISAIDGCTAAHWADVLEIFSEAIEAAGFEPNLVSNAEEVTLIHKTIIQNVYDNPIVLCDVSGKNPNAMFELGMRLAFDKPTIIVKDDKTTYSFDTGAIEHLEYPRDLRFNTMVEFKKTLQDKIMATHQKATTDSGYTPFLKHFGEFTVAKLDKKEVSKEEFIVEELKSIRTVLNRLGQQRVVRELRRPEYSLTSRNKKVLVITLTDIGSEIGRDIYRYLTTKYPISQATFKPTGASDYQITLTFQKPISQSIQRSIESFVMSATRTP